MDIEALSGALSGIQSIGSPGSAAKAEENTSSFSSLLTEALNNIEGTEAANQQGTVALLTGEDESIHTAMIESEKSQLALDLAIQVRNKVMDSYKEIMQMQV